MKHYLIFGTLLVLSHVQLHAVKIRLDYDPDDVTYRLNLDIGELIADRLISFVRDKYPNKSFALSYRNQDILEWNEGLKIKTINSDLEVVFVFEYYDHPENFKIRLLN